MTAHELAKKLMEMPDVPVFVCDGSNPLYYCEAIDIVRGNGYDTRQKIVEGVVIV